MLLSRYMLIGCLLVLPLVVRAAEEQEEQAPKQHQQQQIAEWRRNLEWKETEQKAAFRQAMRNMSLQERRLEVAEQEATLKAVAKPQRCPAKDSWGLLVVACALVHVLLGVWVFQDIRQRRTGSGVWIVIVLVTGLMGAFVYALVRIGDARQPSVP